MAHLKTPISVIAQVLSALTEGMGINAVTRLYGVSKKSIYRWARAPQWLQKTLLLFALTHQFLQQLIEGDELYTRGHKKVAPDASPGWTVVLMDRATRFLWDMHCGRKDRKMFKKTLGLLCQVIQQTGDLGRSACGVCTQQRMTEEIAQAFAFAARTLLEAGELSREGGKACYLLL
jgi:hypothetical protein